jgi:serine/threonine-protein kinase
MQAAEQVSVGDATLEPDTRVGRWRIVRPIGSGGMATVYEAVHADLGRRAALKILHARHVLDRDIRLRFVREGKAACRLSHPHIVPIHDAGIDGDHAYLVMELLRGETLAEHLARVGRVPAAECARLLLPIAAALATVHAEGIVHRDVKPSNIFVERRERDGENVRPLLLDFGTSRFVGGSDDDVALTRTRSLLGTPAYMSPEQAEGARNVDARSDQFSLAVVAYECVTGRRAFDAATWQRALVALLNANVVAPRKHVPSIPGAFEKVILRAIATDPSARFDDMHAFASALADAAGVGARSLWKSLAPIAPRTAIAPTRARSPRRHRHVSIAVATIGALALPVLAWQLGGGHVTSARHASVARAASMVTRVAHRAASGIARSEPPPIRTRATFVETPSEPVQSRSVAAPELDARGTHARSALGQPRTRPSDRATPTRHEPPEQLNNAAREQSLNAVALTASPSPSAESASAGAVGDETAQSLLGRGANRAPILAH